MPWFTSRAACALLCLCAPAARAQPAPTAEPAAPAPAPAAPAHDEAQRNAMARALFEEGLGFVDRGQWSDAADRFRRVLEVRYSAVAAYNLGLAQARLGKLVVAAETLRKLVSDASIDATARDSARALLAEVEPKLSWLTIRIAGGCHGCSVAVDDAPWPDAALGVAMPIDPGKHKVALRRGDETLRTRPLELAPGAHESQSLSLAAPAPTPAQAAAAAPAAAEPDGSAPAPELTAQRDDPGPSVWASPWLWGGVGAAVVAAGVVLAVAMSGSPAATPASAVPGDFTPAVIEVRP